MPEEIKPTNEINAENPTEKSAEVIKLEADLAKVSGECDEYLNGWKRAKADFINYKKEEIARFSDTIKFANEDLIRDLIPVLDSFDLGLAALTKAGPVEKGVYMIKGQLEDVLRRRGLEKIKVTPGEEFNPLYHEAVGITESPPDKNFASHTVAEEVESGYTYQSKVVRPARVKLTK